MKDFRQLQNAWGLLILRLGSAGMLFGAHGWDKLSNLSDKAGSFPDPLGIGSIFSLFLAVFAETVCALLVTLGCFTRLAAIPLVINMLVAALLVHGDDPWSKKEFALLYAIPFVTILLTGPGPYSFDAWRERRRAQTERKKLRT